MYRVHVSIARLMGLVIFAGMGFAALRNASPLWAGAVALGLMAMMGLALLGVIYSRGRARAFWVGFALFEGLYVGISFEFLFGAVAPLGGGGQWVPRYDRPPNLATTILESLQQFVGPERGSAFGESFVNPFLANRHDRGIRNALEQPVSMAFTQETALEDVLAYVKSTTQSDELPNGVPLYVNPRGLQQAEKTLQSPVTLNLPGLPLKTTLRLLLRQLDLEYSVQNGLLAIDYIGARDSQVDDAFQRVGHGLFAMVFAGVGGIAGLLFYAAREREANQAASSA